MLSRSGVWKRLTTISSSSDRGINFESMVYWVGRMRENCYIFVLFSLHPTTTHDEDRQYKTKSKRTNVCVWFVWHLLLPWSRALGLKIQLSMSTRKVRALYRTPKLLNGVWCSYSRWLDLRAEESCVEKREKLLRLGKVSRGNLSSQYTLTKIIIIEKTQQKPVKGPEATVCIWIELKDGKTRPWARTLEQLEITPTLPNKCKKTKHN